MTEKRFTVHIKWFNYDKTEGEITLKDNGQPLLESECIEDVQRVKVLFNELNDEVKSQSLVIKEYQNRNEALLEEIARQKFSKGMMRDNIKDYEKSIKNL